VFGFLWVFCGGEKGLYCVLRHKIQLCGWKGCMENYQDKEEIRWQVVKAMLDEFPTLRQKVKNYVQTAKN
jgi:hypothetical protein